MSILFIKMGLSAFLASLGFGLLFNIKGKNLFLAGLVGGVGGVCYKISLYYGCNEILANFIGVIALSFLSEILARKCKSPVTTFLVCGPLLSRKTRHSKEIFLSIRNAFS